MGVLPYVGMRGLPEQSLLNSPIDLFDPDARNQPFREQDIEMGTRVTRSASDLGMNSFNKQVKEVFPTIAPAVGLSVGLAVGQSSIADEISELIRRPKLEAGICYDPGAPLLYFQSSVDILVATPGRLMHHMLILQKSKSEDLTLALAEATRYKLIAEIYNLVWVSICAESGLFQASIFKDDLETPINQRDRRTQRKGSLILKIIGPHIC